MFFDLWITDVQSINQSEKYLTCPKITNVIERSTDVDVATKEAKSGVGLGCDVVNMLVPAQVVRYLDTKVLGNVYMFQLMIFQCVRILSCLCLLDLSAAFDTTDHNILLTCLASWFSMQGTALNCFRFYLSSRCFRVECNGVPQGSVLGPLLFVMYTTPHSTIVSSLSLNHHLYADDKQLFLSFHPSDFHCQHQSLTKCSTTDLFLDDCQSSYSQLF